MILQQSSYSSRDFGRGERHSARVTDGFYIRAARNWGKNNDGPPDAPTTEHKSENNNENSNKTNSTQYSTRPSFQRPTQVQANWLVASAQAMAAPCALRGHRELCSDTLVARLPALSCLTCSFKTYLYFIDNISYTVTAHGPTYVCTAMHNVRPQARMPTNISSVVDESSPRASPALLLSFGFLRSEAHTE